MFKLVCCVSTMIVLFVCICRSINHELNSFFKNFNCSRQVDKPRQTANYAIHCLTGQENGKKEKVVCVCVFVCKRERDRERGRSFPFRQNVTLSEITQNKMRLIGKLRKKDKYKER